MYHIIKVMRMKPNDKIEVVYNHSTYLCELNENYEAVLIATLFASAGIMADQLLND